VVNTNLSSAGHFLLTKLLLPLLIATAKVRSDGQARVVSVSSYAHTMFPDVDFNTLKDSPARSRLRPDQLYGQSKFASIRFWPFRCTPYSFDLVKGSNPVCTGARREIQQTRHCLYFSPSRDNQHDCDEAYTSGSEIYLCESCSTIASKKTLLMVGSLEPCISCGSRTGCSDTTSGRDRS